MACDPLARSLSLPQTDHQKAGSTSRCALARMTTLSRIARRQHTSVAKNKDTRGRCCFSSAFFLRFPPRLFLRLSRARLSTRREKKKGEVGLITVDTTAVETLYIISGRRRSSRRPVNLFATAAHEVARVAD